MNNESNRMKNCMWDTWDGVKFYPRPYDMDTEMGLSNTGTETIRVDAEILPELSPFEATGTYAGCSYTDTTTDLRYLSFNTKTSKLWNAFASEFANEIKSTYQSLRSEGIYSFNAINTFVSGMTTDIIGAGSKYLSQTSDKNSEYLKMLHGNRMQKYGKFLKERLTFLDTVYDYMESEVQADTLNSIITLRSDALYGQSATETLRCYLGISVYSPQYVTISVGSGMDAIVTGYVGPESTYKDPETGITYEGTLFSFPIRGTDKEMTISGAGNIKNINRLQLLNVRDLVITKAEKLLELDLSYSSRMTALTLGNNKYLRKLSCSNSYLLGTAVNGQLLDLTKCLNLKEVDISWTKINSVNFPKDTVLNKIVLAESSVKNVEIEGAEFFIDITNCVNIARFRLERCNKIETVDVSGSTIQSFLVTNCTKVKTLNVSDCKSISEFDITNSYNIETLIMTGNTSPIMNDLHLYSMYSLRHLYVSRTTSANTIRLPRYLNEIEAAKASNGEDALPWDALETLDLSDSSVVKIQYGSANVNHNVMDMSQLVKLTSLKFSNCVSVTEIRDLTYNSSGNLNGLFSGCKALTKISGTISGSSSVNSMFASCYLLSDISALSFKFNKVTSAQSTFDRCFRATTPMVKQVLDACGDSLTHINGICHVVSMDGYTAIFGTDKDTTRTIPKELFEKTPNIQVIDSAFDITGYTTIPGDLLDNFADKLTSAYNAFGRMSNLKTVGKDLLKNKPKLTNVQHMFANAAKLEYFIDEDPNIFVGSPKITNTRGMFENCHNLRLGSNGFGEMMYPLTELSDCRYMFYQCYNNLNGNVPNGFLSKNTKLTDISGLFARCRVLQELPRSLFRVKVSDNTSFPLLKKAMCVFSDCRALTGVVHSTFFAGAEGLQNISYDSEINMYMTTSRYPVEGFFYNTNITGYYEDFLSPLKNVQRVGGMFQSCNNLSTCYYYDNSVEKEYSNSVSENIFKENKLLTSTNNFFYDCTSIRGHIPPKIFDPCRTTITEVSSMFRNCTSLTAINLDDTTGNSFTGISNKLFKNAGLLNNTSYFLSGSNVYAGTIPEDLFENCSNLSNTAYMFHECRMISGGVPLKLFHYCRGTLTNTAYMFYNCQKLTEPLPTGEYRTETGVVGYTLCKSDDEGALRVVQTMKDPYTEISYAAVVDLSPNLSTQITATGGYYVQRQLGDTIVVDQLGLLSECLKLTNVEGMFCYCLNMTGGIPHDLFFTSSLSKRYDKLTNVAYLFQNCQKMNKAYEDPDTGILYLCSRLFFEKCPNITTVASTFNRMYGMPACQVHPNMFDKQTKISNANELFMGTRNLTGPISGVFMRNTLASLQYAPKMFSHTNMTSVDPNFLNGGGVNTRLLQIYGIFYTCSNLSGTSPAFWDGTKFTAIQGTQSGYWGALYGCTKLSNYSTAQGVSANWTNSQPIYL